MSIRTIIADDHGVLRHALGALLALEPDVAVIGEAATGAQAIELAERLDPDVMVLDLVMPDIDGVQVAQALRTRAPRTRVVVLTARTEKFYVLQVISAGVQAYVLKDAASTELVRAVRAAAGGQGYVCPEIAAMLASHAAAALTAEHIGVDLLSRRERSVLALLAQGKRSRDIGSRLSIATATVEVHRRNIMRKLDIHTVPELTKLAVREGLVPY